MGSITTGIGLISGIDSGQLIDQLIALESRGKITLQNRLSRLQQQQTAMLSINSRLLALKNVAGSFRKDNVFQSMTATSSNPDVLTASASSKAVPGNFSFSVKQLVSTSQQLSKGFASKNDPVGLDTLGFNFGNVTLEKDIALEHLNGGQGVSNGKITITDGAGNSGTIDLTAATTMNEVIGAINGSNTVDVTARVDGDRLVIDDNSGGAGSLSVNNAVGYSTATDLGIVGSGQGTITGDSIHYLDTSSSLSILNDGNGALIKNNVSDLRIIDRNGATHNIDFGQINLDIDSDTLLSELNDGEGITLSDDSDNPDITFIARDGEEYEVDLTGVSTVGELISRVDNATGGQIQLEVTDGKRLSVVDNSGGDGTLKVLGAGVNGTTTAEELGILNEEGVEEDSFVGEIIPNTLVQAAAGTIQDMIDRVEEQTNGAVTLAVADDGRSLKVIDNTGGGGELKVEATSGNQLLAGHLGLATDGVEQDEFEGEALIASLGSVLVKNLNGGQGLDGASTLELTDRAGNSVTINALDQFDSLDAMLSHINDEAANAGVNITASVNNAGTGLEITDDSGATASNLIVAGDAAAALGIAADTASNSVKGQNLNHQFITQATKLSDMNYGRGISTGSFEVIDGFGNSMTINVGANQKTLHDVILSINGQANAQGVAVNARVNDDGSGLLIEENLPPGETPSSPIRVQAGSGSTARDLNILGESSTTEGAFIDGGYARSIDVSETDTLNDIVNKINDSGIPVSASILQTGSSTNPYRISFTSGITGANGELVIDSGDADLGLTTLSKGEDAKVFFGQPGSEASFLITSTSNTVENVVDGLTLNLTSVSDSPVTISVEQDSAKITKQVESFVKEFNETIAKIDEFDFFDVDEEKRGILLGNPTTSRVRSALFRAIQQPAEGVSTQYQRLHQIGITVGSGGQLDFDKSKFEQAMENDPKAVENLLAAYDTQPSGEDGEPEVTARGLGQIFDDLLANFTDQFDGTMKRVDESFNSQIRLVNDRIEAFDVRLEARRKRLERQFAAMEQSLAQLQNQSGALNSLQGNLQMAGALFG